MANKAPNQQAAITVNNVSKNFVLPHERQQSIKQAFTGLFRGSSLKDKDETQHALKDISFEVKKGEFFGIVGRNGSGKSTLLKLLAGIYQPTGGKISTYGKLVPFIELGVGFNPELTGRENVYLNGAMFGFSKSEIDRKYKDIVEFAELEDFMDQKLKNYSSGMQVRLAFSIATRAKADILLIDEVLAVGDADFQRKCFDYFKSLKRSGTTVIFVSHDMDAIREYCDRAVLVEKSRIIEAGSTDAIAQGYTKLFMVESATSAVADGNYRWGKGGIQTSKVVATTADKSLTIVQNIKVNQAIEDPIIGIRIRSVSGVSVTGTNTKIENIKTGKLRRGDELTVTWSLPSVLADGGYLVDPAILGADGVTVWDWWDEAARFVVKKERNLPYLVDPDFDINITKKQ